MWAAQRFNFEEPNRWMTSGGLGTMGYGLPAALGVQMAHPDALVIDIAGEASVQMTMQEMSTAVQYDLPVKIFILNNQYMGMVRQWQQLLHGGRYSHSYSEALPDFVKMAEAFGCVGLRADTPDELDGKIKEMIAVKRPVLFDCRVDPKENCYPMIPSGAAHNEMILSDAEEEPPKSATKERCWSDERDDQNCRPIERHTIAILVDNEAGVLARVVGLFSGRGYNIESLTVAEVDHVARTSRITVVTSGTPAGDRADRGAVAPPRAGSPRRQLDRVQARHRARNGAGQGRRHRRQAGRGHAHCRDFPRPHRRYHPYQLRLRDHRAPRPSSTSSST